MIIDACLIVKNEEKNIKNVIDNLLKFSTNVYIVDTGSTDSTIEIITKSFKSYGYTNRVHVHFFKWINNFSAARNYALSLSKDSDYIFWCDGDESLSEEFIERLLKLKDTPYSEDLPDIYAYGISTTNVFSGYVSSVFSRFGILKSSKNFRFVDPVHEYIKVSYENTIDYDYFSGCMVMNYYDKTGDEKFRNFDIYARTQTQRNLNCREYFYAANELSNLDYVTGAFLMVIESILHKDCKQEAIDSLYDYITFYDCYDSCRNINSVTIEDITNHMIKEKMFNKCVLLMFSRVLYKYEYYDLALECAEISYNMTNIGIEQLLYPYAYNEIECLFNLVLCYDKKQKYKTANMYNNMILQIQPNNECALYNKKYFENLINDN